MNLEILNKPYPYTGNFSASVKAFTFISGFIFLFVFFFRSDQLIPNANYGYRLLISFYFGLITFFGATFNSIILGLFITQKDEKNWKVWHEILLYIIHFTTISISIFFLSSIISEIQLEFSFMNFFKSVSSTVLVGSIPVSIHIINEQKKLFKKNYELAAKLSPTLQDKKIDQDKTTLTINQETIIISDILYVESNKNYVDIVLHDNDEVKIRMTMREMESKLSEFSQFVRCHRAFIVNTKKIKNVKGNAQGLKLYLDGITSYVPVSRSYIPKIKYVIRPSE